jgi:hypothetical protein
MKNNSTIILEKLIQQSLNEQTGLVHEPKKSTNKTNSNKSSSSSWLPSDLGSWIMWGSIALAVTGVLGHYGIKWNMARRLGKKNLDPALGKMMTTAEKAWTTLDTLALLRLYRGLGSKVNIEKFKTWIIENRTIYRNLPGDQSLYDFAAEYSTKLDPQTIQTIWNVNKEKFVKAGMTRITDNIPAGGVQKLKIPRKMSKQASDDLLKVLNNRQAIYSLRNAAFKRAYRAFKRGKIDARTFINELPPELKTELGPGLRNMERAGRAGAGVSSSPTAPVIVNVNPTPPPAP